MGRPHPPRTPIERDIVEAERAVAAFADATPRGDRHRAAVRQRARARRSRPRTRGCSRCPPCRSILGFDPRYQFVHEDDIVGCLELAVRNDLPGHLQLRRRRRARALRGRSTCSASRSLPILPPWGTGLGRRPRCAGSGIRIPPEMLQPAAVRARRSTTAGSRPPATRTATRRARRSRPRRALRLRPLLRGGDEPYRYEREVEEFLRRSPTVRQRPEPRWAQEAEADVDALDGLDAAALIALLPSLPRPELEALGRHEAGNARRPEVLAAIGRNLARSRSVTGTE